MKKVVKIVYAALVSAALFSSCYIQKESEQIRSITVNGTGTVTVPVDSASVEFTVVTNGWSAKSIVTDNDTLSNRLIEAAKGKGVNADDITLSECTVSMPTSQYEARRTVRIVTHNVKLVPEIVDCKLPGNQIRLGKTEYFVGDKASVLRRVRTAAIQNAQDTAALLSGASGSKIGDATNIYECEVKNELTSDGKSTTSLTIMVTYNLE